MIRIQNLHKYFNKGRPNEIHVIDGVSLELPERGMTAIFGKSGCGKTTLLNVIGGLDGFASGSVTVDGRDVRTDTDDLRNREIGYIFQNYNLHKDRSCFENVADALRLCGLNDGEELERRVTAALRNVGMEKYAKRPPNTLSGGQQQRIAIARAIVKNPRIILADEPTGNLDEANTVMIMNLLKSISKDHLVLLVTHEAKLVDYYCDTVIELSDGRIVGEKRNENADGYAVKDKNHVYLGELPKSRFADDRTDIEFYGDAPEHPIRIRIVNSGGRLLAQFLGEDVQLLDDSSEVKLLEGVFEEKSPLAEEEAMDMSALPPVRATQTGKLFSWRSSVKSGYDANFRNNKKGKRVLRTCMCLFAAIIVFMSAAFGTSIRSLLDANDAFNHNVFYLYTPDGGVSDRLLAAMESGEAAIDFIRLNDYYIDGDSFVGFRTSGFETFSTPFYTGVLLTNAVLLDRTVSKDLPVLAGTDKDLKDEDLLITKRVAQALIEQSSYGYITEYRDLIGLISTEFQTAEGKYLRIAGVLDSDETAVYLPERVLADYILERANHDKIEPADRHGLSVKKGETALVLSNDVASAPALGAKVRISGVEFTVSEIIRYASSYPKFLESKGIEKPIDAQYFTDIVKKEFPALREDSPEFEAKFAEICDLRYADYLDFYYAELPAFLEHLYLFRRNTAELWMYFEKDCKDFLYLYASTEYYSLQCYRALYGKTPSASELSAAADAGKIPPLELIHYYDQYEEEFNLSYTPSLPSQAYMLCPEDYVSLSKRTGETDECAKNATPELLYTVIHSTDPKVTEQWITAEFSDLDTGYDYMKPILTPDTVRRNVLRENIDGIVGGLLAIVLLLTIMSVCMYFIMRSALMNRIKEVGIYRAIGVSKRNILFRFFVEAGVLATLTVLPGYLCTSAFIFACLELSPLVTAIFYYPGWLALCVCIVLYALSLVCGTIPVLSLLRKTPSEILAKYDI